MKVRELIAVLEDHNPEAVVMIYENEDSYTEANFVLDNLAINENGEIGLLNMDVDLEEMGFSESDDVIENGEPCVVITS